MAGESWQDNDLIFCQCDGTPYKPDAVTRRFKRLAALAGLVVIKLHEGRPRPPARRVTPLLNLRSGAGPWATPTRR
jgi:hypothetical protein